VKIDEIEEGISFSGTGWMRMDLTWIQQSSGGNWRVEFNYQGSVGSHHGIHPG
jgi:hypothetical protein